MDYRRLYQPGGVYFFTVVTEGRRPLLIEHAERLRVAFRHVRNKHPFEIQAIVILPDHLHSLWRLPEGDTDFSGRWMAIKRKFSTGFVGFPPSTSKVNKREKGIWQRRFWEHCIRDEGDWRRHMDYIHYNPVKHGHADAPCNWPYSSFTRHVANGYYDLDWGRSEPDSILDLDLD